MNVDHILTVMNQHDVRYLLIGGMNFMLRHKPVLTYDVDLWIEDTEENRRHCEEALTDLDAAWGRTEGEWTHVRELPQRWLDGQGLFCLSSAHGAIDIMRSVRGLSDWQASWDDAREEKTRGGTPYRGLSDDDMLRCQLALDEGDQKAERIRILKESLGR